MAPITWSSRGPQASSRETRSITSFWLVYRHSWVWATASHWCAMAVRNIRSEWRRICKYCAYILSCPNKWCDPGMKLVMLVLYRVRPSLHNFVLRWNIYLCSYYGSFKYISFGKSAAYQHPASVLLVCAQLGWDEGGGYYGRIIVQNGWWFYLHQFWWLVLGRQHCVSLYAYEHRNSTWKNDSHWKRSRSNGCYSDLLNSSIIIKYIYMYSLWSPEVIFHVFTVDESRHGHLW